MPMSALTGTRLRERRLALGLRQADVAREAGVSASYLNLIEHNRRRVTAEVLEALAGVLGMPLAALREGAGGTLLEDLRAAAAAAGEGTGAELDRVEEFAGRFPGWAAALIALERRAAGLERAVEALNDRMTHDPHLSASLHEMLSAVSSVRSTAEILAEPGEIAPEWRERFLRNLFADSERLAAGSEALVAYLDGSEQAGVQGIAAPQEELEAWLAGRGWHVPELEPGGAGPEAVLHEVAGLVSGGARVLARDWVARAAAEAAALPLEMMEAEGARAGDAGRDPLRIAQMTGLSVVAVMRRMALRPGATAGLVVCDGSGTMTFRKPAEGFAVPRFGAACPLWPIFAALGRPGSPVLADLVTVGRGARRFRALAWCDLRHPEGLGGVELREAAMLIWPLEGAATGVAAQQVGTSCRVCARTDCPARREPSIMGEAE
ncbi:MAG: short-chain fatty acyl-CoA regulator family protein [Rhodobacteraceae bacterium]|nr:short-chain fatty acyl-CoA regulator family protein [Paracoccaceae bacterium]MCZ8083851.1 short-chain fatty acyl-CoA regulator family protein [Paracoccaceae bacterium]